MKPSTPPPPNAASAGDAPVPRISVLTPCFNSRRFIGACIENVLAQSCPQAEHVIVDGGSEDGTVEIIAGYAANHPSIRWVSAKDRGQSDAMNKAITLARGEVISFLNADDYYNPGVLNRVGGLLDTVRGPAFLTGKCAVWRDGSLYGLYKPTNLSYAKVLTGLFPPNPSAYFYHRELHDRHGGYAVEDAYSMDLEFMLRVFPHVPIHAYDEVWGNFVLHEDCKTGRDMAAGNDQGRWGDLLDAHREKLGWLGRLQLGWAFQTTRNPVCKLLHCGLTQPRYLASTIRRALRRQSAEESVFPPGQPAIPASLPC